MMTALRICKTAFLLALIVLFSVCKKESVEQAHDGSILFSPYGFDRAFSGIGDGLPFIQQILKTGDGSLYLRGYPDDGYAFPISRLNASLKLILQKRPIFGYPYGDLLPLSNGNLGYVTFSYDSTSGDPYLQIWKVDRDLNVLSKKNWKYNQKDTMGRGSLYGFHSDGDGGIIIQNSVTEFNLSSQIFLMHYNKDSIDWNVATPFSEFKQHTRYYAKDASNYYIIEGGSDKSLIIHKLDINSLKSGVYKEFSATPSSLSMDLAKTMYTSWFFNEHYMYTFSVIYEYLDSKMYVTGIQYNRIDLETGNGISNIIPIRFAVTGSIQDLPIIRSTAFHSGNIFLAFNYVTSAQNYLLKIDNSGNLIFKKSIGGDLNKNYGAGVHLVNDQLWFCGSGTLKLGKVPRNYIIKYDLDGNLLP